LLADQIDETVAEVKLEQKKRSRTPSLPRACKAATRRHLMPAPQVKLEPPDSDDATFVIDVTPSSEPPLVGSIADHIMGDIEPLKAEPPRYPPTQDQRQRALTAQQQQLHEAQQELHEGQRQLHQRTEELREYEAQLRHIDRQQLIHQQTEWVLRQQREEELRSLRQELQKAKQQWYQDKDEDQQIDDKKDQQTDDKKDQQIDNKKDQQWWQIDDKNDQHWWQNDPRGGQQIDDQQWRQNDDKKDQHWWQSDDKKNQQSSGSWQSSWTSSSWSSSSWTSSSKTQTPCPCGEPKVSSECEFKLCGRCCKIEQGDNCEFHKLKRESQAGMSRIEKGNRSSWYGVQQRKK